MKMIITDALRALCYIGLLFATQHALGFLGVQAVEAWPVRWLILVGLALAVLHMVVDQFLLRLKAKRLAAAMMKDRRTEVSL